MEQKALCDIYPQYCSSHHHQLDSHSLKVKMEDCFQQFVWTLNTTSPPTGHLLTKYGRMPQDVNVVDERRRETGVVRGGQQGAPVPAQLHSTARASVHKQKLMFVKRDGGTTRY